jgi:hypothetical protein
MRTPLVSPYTNCPSCKIELDTGGAALGTILTCSECGCIFPLTESSIRPAKPEVELEPEAPRPFRMKTPRSQCRRCSWIGTKTTTRRRISTHGWIGFGVLLVLFVSTFVLLAPLCCLALLIREEYPVCPRCGTSVE